MSTDFSDVHARTHWSSQGVYKLIQNLCEWATRFDGDLWCEKFKKLVPALDSLAQDPSSVAIVFALMLFKSVKQIEFVALGR